jgi:iron uptake system EfeUOB component EfeO/EfeM
MENVTDALNANIDGFDVNMDAAIKQLEAAQKFAAAVRADEASRLAAMEADARLYDIQVDGHEAMIAELDERIEAAREDAEAGDRRAGMAIQGTQEFAQAIAEHMTPRQDRQFTALQKLLEEEKAARRALDKIVEQGHHAPRLIVGGV